MKRHLFKPALLLFISVLLTSCAHYRRTDFQPLDITPKVNSGYVQKADSFLLIADASSSMYESLQPKSFQPPYKYDIALETAENLNQAIPSIPLQAGLRIFGPAAGAEGLKYGMTTYAKEDFGNALQIIAATSGTTPLADALAAADPDLSSLQGQLAAIIMSHGRATDEPVLENAAALRKHYGDRLCIHTITIGNDPAGNALMQKIASDSGCGTAVNAAAIASPDAMANFVQEVFLEKDTDRDGVGDSRDKCPDTPAGIPVDANGCPPDSDGDGVPDYLDICPNTPPVTKVDDRGCPPMVSMDLYIEFDSDKSTVKEIYCDDIGKVARILDAYPQSKIGLEGHTDSTGPEEYNMGLSIRRANAVRDHMIKKHEIAPTRISTKGYGETRPVASNDTKEGLQKNRRVTAKITPTN